MSEVESFSEIVSREFLVDMEPVNDRSEIVYGCRVLFYKTDDPTKHMSKLVPWLTYERNRATQMRAELAHNMTATRLRGFVKYDSRKWTPMGARVVELAEVPF